MSATLRRWSGSVLKALAAAAVLFGASSAALADKITYYHNDLLGSPMAATDATGQVLWRETWLPYGERLQGDEASLSNKIRYTSRHQDDDTGLVYMGARYYDPLVGRFMSVDAVGFSATNIHSFNRYAYANNNPLNFVDLDGRWATSVHKAAAVQVLRTRIHSVLLQSVLDAQEAADHPANQTPAFSHLHAMRRDKQDVHSARKDSEDYIRKQFALGWTAEDRGDKEAALRHFGMALHTLQDDTSPSHRGFQVWDGFDSGAIGHLANDLNILGPEYRELTDVTQRAWQWFRERNDPQGCLLSCNK